MKRIIALSFTLLLAMMQVPVLAADAVKESGKDLCLLYSQNCAGQSLSYQEQIARLREEINKGTQVYSPAELQRLEDKRKDAEAQIDILLYSPSHHGGSHR